MQKTKTLIISTALISGLFGMEAPIVIPDILNPITNIQKDKLPSVFVRTGPTVQIGILLDTSSSMDGLISQAKEQLWKIVNEVAKANKNNKEVVIQVGLFEYGKDSLPQYEGYLQMLSPLTSDLDKVSQSLFELRTNGGQEYAGKVILESINRFVWSQHKDDLKLLIIAGNESFAQGSVPYEKAIKKARANGVLVNTIFCGDGRRGINLQWKNGAILGGGNYFNINHNDRREYIETPYDDEIIMLGSSLNNTYLNYGSMQKRRAKKANIARQDMNAKTISKSSYIERNLVKSKSQYTEASTDMVSAYIANEPAVMAIAEAELPDELVGKSKKEIKEIMETKKKDRINLQKKIKDLEVKRESFISKTTKKDDKNLGNAIINSIRKQAIQNGFVFR